MNAEELAANPRLSRWFVQDLNAEPALPFGDGVFDGACLCVSVRHPQRPVDVFRDVGRVLRPGAPLVVSFSNRCFPTKAVAIWQSLSGLTSSAWLRPICGRPDLATLPGRPRRRGWAIRCGL